MSTAPGTWPTTTTGAAGRDEGRLAADEAAPGPSTPRRARTGPGPTAKGPGRAASAGRRPDGGPGPGRGRRRRWYAVVGGVAIVAAAVLVLLELTAPRCPARR